VRHRGFTLWLDAGPGTLANLQTHIGLADVDAVVVSHEHPDHWSDLDGFFVACRWVTPRSHVPVYAPAGLADMMRSGGATEDDSAFDWHVITDKDCVRVGPFDLSFARTEHPPETLAVRFDTTLAGGDPVSFAYTADTGPGWSLDALGRDLDLVVSEATFLRDMEGAAPHLSARQAGIMAKAAGARRLLLTHVWPTVDPRRSAAEATEAFGSPVECCQMHATYRL
jgi:ribonuclease BN (tRNA processing enzyme)